MFKSAAFNKYLNKIKRHIRSANTPEVSAYPERHLGWKERVGIIETQGAPSLSFSENVERCINDTCEKTGCSRIEAIRKIETSVFQTGVSYKDYLRYGFCTMTAGQQSKVQTALKGKLQRKAARKITRDDSLVEQVIAETGWDREYAVEQMRYADDYCGIPYKYFLYSRYWEIDKSTWNEYFSRGQTEMLNRIYNSDPRIVNTIANKGEFCRTYGAYLGRNWLLTDSADYEAFITTFSDSKKIIYKPLASSGGYGIKTFELVNADLHSVFEQIKDLKPGILEEYVVQHPEMCRLSLHAVNTIRIVTIMTNKTIPGIKAGKVYIMYAGARFATGDSVTDNLHSGGLVAGVDLSTGCISTDAVDYNYNVCAVHPDTGTVIKGFKIPCFKEALEMVERAASVNEGYLGWDVAITEHGPTIIECNSFPGAGILQMPYIPLRKGMRHIFKDFLVDIKPPTPSSPKDAYALISDAERITVKWTKAPRSDGYVLYRSYSQDDHFKEIGRLNNAAVSFVDEEFDRSKHTVYYHICSYITRGNGTKAFSTPATAKVEARKDLELVPDVLVLRTGSSDMIHPYCYWGEISGVVWESSNTEVASVDSNGMVTALSQGDCLITCSHSKSGQKASVKVLVDRSCLPYKDHYESRYDPKSTNEYCRISPQSDNKATIILSGSLCAPRDSVSSDYINSSTIQETFRLFRKHTADADFRIGHLNTLLSDSLPYSFEKESVNGRTNINTPSLCLDAIVGTFDSMSAVGSCFLTKDSRSVEETMMNLDVYRIIHNKVGKDHQHEGLVIDINGIKVAFLSYLSGFVQNDYLKESQDCWCIFSAKRIASDIMECKKRGAEYIIVYIDWEMCKSQKIQPVQVLEAQEAADAGADYIVGVNSCCLQPFSIIAATGNRIVPIAFSLGNIYTASGQRSSRESAALRLELGRNTDGSVCVENNTCIPLAVVDRRSKSGLVTIPLDGSDEGKQLKRNYKKMRDRVIKAIGDMIEVV